MKALLPDADSADVAGAVAKYHAFGNRRGTFGALEAAHESCFCSDRITLLARFKLLLTPTRRDSN